MAKSKRRSPCAKKLSACMTGKKSKRGRAKCFKAYHRCCGRSRK